jgi:TRAP-type C4-dicarboxylate transport system permease small subunit
MYRVLHWLADGIARVMAYAGGAVLIALTLATCVSIAGRALVPLDIGVGPIRGIYDFTEIGVAAAVFAFLPWCQLQRGQASVELLTPLFPKVVNRLLDLVNDLGMTLAAAIIAWRLYLGMADRLQYGDITQIAQVPVWYAYLASLVGAAGFVLISAFCVLRSARALKGGAAAEDAGNV